jgi:hypothetical protein
MFYGILNIKEIKKLWALIGEQLLKNFQQESVVFLFNKRLSRDETNLLSRMTHINNNKKHH